jgi:hypothetical protein
MKTTTNIEDREKSTKRGFSSSALMGTNGPLLKKIDVKVNSPIELRDS